MDKNKCIDWIDANQQELCENFIKSKKLKDEFDEYCVEEYNEMKALEGDHIYDGWKDRKL